MDEKSVTRRVIRSALSALVLAFATGASTAQAADKLTIIVGGMGKQMYLPVPARQPGYFKEEGFRPGRDVSGNYQAAELPWQTRAGSTFIRRGIDWASDGRGR